MIAKPPQKEAEMLWRCIVEQENKLKERSKKQMIEEMKREMKKIEDEWFKTFLLHVSTQSL